MKKIGSLLIILALLLMLVPMGALPVAALSGTTGDCTWTLENGHLIISGNGAMADYDDETSAPWGKDIVSVTIEDGVTNIGGWAFKECTSLTTVNIPHSVTHIGDWAFESCLFLTEVTISDHVTSIGSGAFSSCASLENMILPDGLTSISDNMFAGGALKTLFLPKSVTNIGECAFIFCCLTDVYYTGSEQEAASISIAEGNKIFTDASWHYNASKEDNTPKEKTDDSPILWIAIGGVLIAGVAVALVLLKKKKNA